MSGVRTLLQDYASVFVLLWPYLFMTHSYRTRGMIALDPMLKMFMFFFYRILQR